MSGIRGAGWDCRVPGGHRADEAARAYLRHARQVTTISLRRLEGYA
jgi:hypothetical protein